MITKVSTLSKAIIISEIIFLASTPVLFFSLIFADSIAAIGTIGIIVICYVLFHITMCALLSIYGHKYRDYVDFKWIVKAMILYAVQYVSMVLISILMWNVLMNTSSSLEGAGLAALGIIVVYLLMWGLLLAFSCVLRIIALFSLRKIVKAVDSMDGESLTSVLSEHRKKAELKSDLKKEKMNELTNGLSSVTSSVDRYQEYLEKSEKQKNSKR